MIVFLANFLRIVFFVLNETVMELLRIKHVLKHRDREKNARKILTVLYLRGDLLSRTLLLKRYLWPFQIQILPCNSV